MDLAFLTEQRPADVFKAQWSDIKDGALASVCPKQDSSGCRDPHQRKTGKNRQANRRIKSRGITGKTTICEERGQAITYDKFKADFRNARLKAKAYADENGQDFEWFQFKDDLRAKVVSNSEPQDNA